MNLKLYEKGRGDLLYLQLQNLKQTGVVKHLFTTREGGVSDGIYRSMNLSFTLGDKEKSVRKNFERIAEVLGITTDKMVLTDQTHTDNVRLVTEVDAGKGITKERDYTDIDGLITDVPGLALAAFASDCVPLYFVDPVKKAIGLSHAGWRGTVKKIGKNTIEKMTGAFGTDPKDLFCGIGPSICGNCYEVSSDVADEFVAAFDGCKSILTDKGTGKYLLDLRTANKIVMEEAGVLPENIEITDLCTCCNPELLFSHRASKGKRGNNGAFLMLV